MIMPSRKSPADRAAARRDSLTAACSSRGNRHVGVKSVATGTSGLEFASSYVLIHLVGDVELVRGP